MDIWNSLAEAYEVRDPITPQVLVEKFVFPRYVEAKRKSTPGHVWFHDPAEHHRYQTIVGAFPEKISTCIHEAVVKILESIEY